MYSLNDLEKAKKDLDIVNRKWENYSGNNPNKFQSEIKSAINMVRIIEKNLKQNGVIPITEKEKLERKLDELFPDAQSKKIVEHEGIRYQRRFSPREKSRSGKTVTEWDRWWEELNNEE